MKYRRSDNQLIVFADETNPRWVTTAAVLDYDTVAVADKFGNIAVVSSVSPLEVLLELMSSRLQK